MIADPDPFDRCLSDQVLRRAIHDRLIETVQPLAGSRR
jgi:hypothetical protein